MNPPVPQAARVGAPHGAGAPPTAEAKVECTRSTPVALHLGQQTPSAPAPRRCSTSNRSPQLEHRYSYNGIASTLRTGPTESPRGWWGFPAERPRLCSRWSRSSGTARAATLTWELAAVVRHRSGSDRPRRASPRRSSLAALPRPTAAACLVLLFPTAPAPGRPRHRSSRHSQAGQDDPLQQRPGEHNADHSKQLTPAYALSPIIAARPWAISSRSALMCLSRESHTEWQIENTVGSTMR